MNFWRNFAINMELNEEWKVINKEIWVCRVIGYPYRSVEDSGNSNIISLRYS